MLRKIVTVMKKIVLLLMSLVLLTSCQESLEDRCDREAKEFTEKNCPRQIAAEIVMDSMTFEKTTHTISYLYTLNGSLDDTAKVDSAHFTELLLMEVKNSTNLKLYKDAGYSFRYAYYSAKENGTKLFEATFRESDYR
jgi:ADP-ribose pyrophosphatase YjhB (NUDIX family)